MVTVSEKDANISQHIVATRLRCGVVGSLMVTLLQIYGGVFQQNRFENWLAFAKVACMSIFALF